MRRSKRDRLPFRGPGSGRYVSRTQAALAAVAGGALAFGAHELFERPPSALAGLATYAAVVSACSVTDGDTIRCGTERIRLMGIDAPELPGHCRQGRDCAPGDPYASTESLRNAIGGTMTITRIKLDRYGRTIAMVSGPNGDLSCWQLRQHQARYWAKYDHGLRLARLCSSAIR